MAEIEGGHNCRESSSNKAKSSFLQQILDATEKDFLDQCLVAQDKRCGVCLKSCPVFTDSKVGLTVFSCSA